MYLTIIEVAMYVSCMYRVCIVYVSCMYRVCIVYVTGLKLKQVPTSRGK